MDGKLAKHIIRFAPLLLLFSLLGLPLPLLVFQWLTDANGAGPFSFVNGETLVLIAKSLLISSTVAVLATFMGTVCGFCLYKFKFAYSGLYKLLLLLPLLISPYIFAVAWKDGFYWLFGNSSSIYSAYGVIMVHTFAFFPLAMLITGSALSRIHTGFEEAGLMVVPLKRMVLKIMLPLIRPALTISFLLILIFSLSDFSVPAFFNVRTFTTEIFTQFSALYNFSMAIGQSILLLLVIFALLFIEARYLSDAPFFSVSEKGSRSKEYTLKRPFAVHLVLCILLLLVLLTPVLMLVLQSLTGRVFFFAKAWELIRPAAIQSLKLATAGALLVTLIGLWSAYGKERRQYRWPDLILLLTFIVPPTVLGIALIRYYNLPSLNFIYGTSMIILIAWLGKFGFIASRIIGNGIKQIPVSFEEAASVIGIRPINRFLKIGLPLLIPSLFAAFVLAFILCLGELGATMMVYPPGMELMPVKTFTIGANAPQALTSSMTLINLAITLLSITLFFILGKWVFKKFRYA